MTKQKGDTVSSLPARFRQIYYIPFGNCEWIRTLLGGPNPHEYSESLAMPNKVSQPDCGVKDAAHEVALNSYQKVVKANGECAIIEHVEVTGGNYAKFVESKKSHDIEKCATSLDAGIQELGRAEGFCGLKPAAPMGAWWHLKNPLTLRIKF